MALYQVSGIKQMKRKFSVALGVKLDNKWLKDEPWVQVPGSDYSYLIKEISSGIHFAEHESPIDGFGLYVYGFANYDSYGYPGESATIDIE